LTVVAKNTHKFRRKLQYSDLLQLQHVGRTDASRGHDVFRGAEHAGQRGAIEKHSTVLHDPAKNKVGGQAASISIRRGGVMGRTILPEMYD
jgi:hypothetical protein